MTLADEFPLLSKIESPADLRGLRRSDLAAVADELRRYLVHTVRRMGGHIAAGTPDSIWTLCGYKSTPGGGQCGPKWPMLPADSACRLPRPAGPNA